jgi:hypothetical protein
MTRYEVTGPPFQGHQTGDQFDADKVDKDLVRRAKTRGQIRVVKTTTKKEGDDA